MYADRVRQLWFDMVIAVALWVLRRRHGLSDEQVEGLLG